jgi:hypothetical protein
MQIQIDWVLLLIRSVLAAVMIYYGWPKIRDPASNAKDFVRMGFKPGMFWGTLIAVVEFFGGIGDTPRFLRGTGGGSVRVSDDGWHLLEAQNKKTVL